MSLTKAQRRKQNQLNAAHSTGPVTIAGKAASPANSLTHGFTATVLALPNENQADIQAQADAWHDACQPADHDEDVLVDRLALAALRMGRLARAENEILAEQVRRAKIEWDKDQQVRLQNALEGLTLDPVRTMIELRSFGAGVAWMRARWVELAESFDAFGCWNSLHTIKLALRLCGYDPNRVADASAEAQALAALTVSCVSDPELGAHLGASLGFELLEDWRSQCTVEAAVATVRARMMDEVAKLKPLGESLQAIDAESRAGASTRAWLPADTASNRLLLRYTKSAETSFDKSLRALQKLQSDRQKAAEAEAKREAEAARKVRSPNEADQVGRANSMPIHVGTYVNIDGTRYEVVDASDGNFVLLCPEVEVVAATDRGVSTDLGVVPALGTAA